MTDILYHNLHRFFFIYKIHILNFTFCSALHRYQEENPQKTFLFAKIVKLKSLTQKVNPTKKVKAARTEKG